MESVVKQDCPVLCEKLGEGADCVVYSAIFKGRKCTVKFLSEMARLTSRNYEQSRNGLYGESAILKEVGHESIVRLFQPCTKGELAMSFGSVFVADYSVLEILDGGSLSNYAMAQKLTEDELRYYARQILASIIYLHSLGLAHRDIKGDNILLDSSLEVAKLIDFGFATYSKGFSGNWNKGTDSYMAPELRDSAACSVSMYDIRKADVFSLGVTLYTLLTGRFPCSTRCTSSDPTFKHLYNRNYGAFWDQCFKKSGVSPSADFRAMFQDMVDFSTRRRPTAIELMSYSWFAKSVPLPKDVAKAMSARKGL